MSDTSNVLKAPVGGRYDRGWCEPDSQKAKQCIDDSIRVPQKQPKRPARDDRFVRGLNPPISKKIQKLMRNPAWRARQIALLKADMKDDTPTVGKFFENMVKIEFPVLGLVFVNHHVRRMVKGILYHLPIIKVKKGVC